MKLRKRLNRLTNNVRIYYQTLGIRGLLASVTNFAVGAPTHMAVAVPGVEHPLYLRLCTTDPETYRDIFIDGEYDYEVGFTPLTIVDIGANCGMTSVFYASRHPGARVVAVEPEPSNYKALLKNTHPYSNIVPVHAALWNCDGQVEVFAAWPKTNRWGKWGFRVRNGNGCRALTLTTLMKEHRIEKVDILKVDVEGAEREIFENCDWMDKVRFLAIELHDRFRPGCSQIVEAVTKNYLRFDRGPVTFYSRRED